MGTNKTKIWKIQKEQKCEEYKQRELWRAYKEKNAKGIKGRKI